MWNPVLRRSISSEYLETKSLPSRSPPTTPNWYDLQELLSPVCHLIKFYTHLVFLARRSPRVRHGIRKPRPSSVELTNDMKDMSEGEDVFYTYRASVSSSKDSEGDTSPHQLVSVTTDMVSQSLSEFSELWWYDICSGCRLIIFYMQLDLVLISGSC